MFDQAAFGEKLKRCRKERNLTQEEVAEKISVSGQAVSKWEKGECLPEVYNLKLLGRVYRVSLDNLLDMENGENERIVETIKIGGAIFEVVERPETILAGRIIYGKDYPDIDSFNAAFESADRSPMGKAADCVLPLYDISLSVNFWLGKDCRAGGFVRETTSERQPEGVDICKMPPSLYIRAYTDRDTALLVAKESCEIWELFAYIRNYVMPPRGFKMADNGAQELEVFDNAGHTTGYAYVPVMRE